jgi:hypothetical protein
MKNQSWPSDLFWPIGLFSKHGFARCMYTKTSSLLCLEHNTWSTQPSLLEMRTKVPTTSPKSETNLNYLAASQVFKLARESQDCPACPDQRTA